MPISQDETDLAKAILAIHGSSIEQLDKAVTDAYQVSVTAAIDHLAKVLPKPLQMVALAGVTAIYEAKSIGLRTAMEMGEEARDLVHEMGMRDASSLKDVLRRPA